MSTPVIGAATVKPVANERPVEYRRIYVWQVPVRLFHWVTALSIVGLCLTGFLIGYPLDVFYSAQAYLQYYFGWVRFIHFTCAFVLVAVSLLRLYWAVAGNRYANWRNFLPLTKSQRMDIWELISVEMLQIKKHGSYHVGHNAMAALSYFFMFLAFLFQTVTGLALYAGMSNAWITHMFNWVVPLMGGDANVRFWHHAFLWIFVCFVIVHVYLAIYDDYVEGRGEISAMVGGWKFKRDDREK
jgi:Ni/Fe-hydrogenase 1 B-type cytochrome subunit